MMTPQDTKTLEFERRIAASPETVFSYFVDPAKYSLWQGVEARLDAQAGGEFFVRMTEASAVRGRYVEVVPYSRIVYTWGWESRVVLPPALAEVLPGSTTVEVTLSPVGDGTLLRLRHLGFASLAATGGHTMGWTAYLERLGRIAEGGDPGPDPIDSLRQALMNPTAAQPG